MTSTDALDAAPRVRLAQHTYVSPPPWELRNDADGLVVIPHARMSRSEIGCCAAVTFIAAPLFALGPCLMGERAFAIGFGIFIGLMGPGGLAIAWVMKKGEQMAGPWLEFVAKDRRLRLPRLNRTLPISAVVGFQGLHGVWRTSGRSRYIAELNIVVKNDTGELERLPVVATYDPAPIQTLGRELASAMQIGFAMFEYAGVEPG